MTNGGKNMGPVALYKQTVLNYEEFLISKGGEDGEDTLESRVMFVFFSFIVIVSIILFTGFFLGKFDITGIVDADLDAGEQISFNKNEEFDKVLKFIKQNSDKIQRLHFIVGEEKERSIKEIITAFFGIFGDMGKRTEAFVNCTLEECKFSEIFDYCSTLGVRNCEDIIKYMFTVIAKNFMQKVIEHYDSNEECKTIEEDSCIRRIDITITAIEGDVVILNYLFQT